MAPPPHGASTEIAREIELKLLLDPADIEAVLHAAAFERRALGRPTRRPLHSRYFDTSDLALTGDGLALRVRGAGSRTIQTIKGRGAAADGPFARLEVESEIAGPLPEISAIPDEALRARVAELVADQALEPVLDTEVERTTLRLREGRATIDADLDVGEIRTPAGTLPICELELELVDGDPVALPALALELARELHFRLATASKLDRGLALLTGRRSAPVCTRLPAIDGDAPFEEALGTILTACLEQVLANEAAAYDGTDPEGVQQMRIGVRRMRSLLGLCRRMLPRDACEALRKELWDLTSSLGSARDVDVLIEELLGPIRERAAGGALVAELCAEAERLREERYIQLRQWIDSERFTRLMLDLDLWIASLGWRDQRLSPDSARLFQPAREVARWLLKRRYKKVRKLGRGLETADDAQRHALCVEIGKLRDAAELLAGAFPEGDALDYAKDASRAEAALGRLQERVQARELLGLLAWRLGAAEDHSVHAAVGFVLGWSAYEAGGMIDASERAWKRLRKAPRFWR